MLSELDNRKYRLNDYSEIERIEDRVASQDNTVNYDQRNIDSQRIVKARNKSL